MSGFSQSDWTVLVAMIVAVVGTHTLAAHVLLAAIRDIHRAINSRMDELVAETKRASIAEGRDQMRDERLHEPKGPAA